MMRLLPLMLLAVLTACAARGTGDAGAPDRVPVEVENQNFYEATIYAYRNGARVRLGEVPGNQTATLSAPFPPRGEISFDIRLLAVGAYTSQSVAVSPGDTVRIVVPANLHRYPPG